MTITPVVLVFLYLLAALALTVAVGAAHMLARRCRRMLARRRELREALAPGWWLRFEREFQTYAGAQWRRAREAEHSER